MASIQKEFKLLLEKVGTQEGFQCKRFKSIIRDTNNIVELSGHINCLLYFKIRSADPYRWGVTNNRMEELKASRKKWFVVLLYETPDNGYLLTPSDVRRYVKENLWPLGRGKNKNEYKVGPRTTLQYNEPFETFRDFIKSLRIKLQQ